MKKIYLIAAVIALAAGVATYFFASELKKETQEVATTAVETQAVLVATEDIPQNTILTEEMFEEKQLPKDAVSDGTVGNIDEAVGFMSTEKILKGDFCRTRLGGIFSHVQHGISINRRKAVSI